MGRNPDDIKRELNGRFAEDKDRRRDVDIDTDDYTPADGLTEPFELRREGRDVYVGGMRVDALALQRAVSKVLGEERKNPQGAVLVDGLTGKADGSLHVAANGDTTYDVSVSASGSTDDDTRTITRKEMYDMLAIAQPKGPVENPYKGKPEDVIRPEKPKRDHQRDIEVHYAEYQSCRERGDTEGMLLTGARYNEALMAFEKENPGRRVPDPSLPGYDRDRDGEYADVAEYARDSDTLTDWDMSPVGRSMVDSRDIGEHADAMYEVLSDEESSMGDRAAAYATLVEAGNAIDEMYNYVEPTKFEDIGREFRNFSGHYNGTLTAKGHFGEAASRNSVEVELGGTTYLVNNVE